MISNEKDETKRKDMTKQAASIANSRATRAIDNRDMLSPGNLTLTISGGPRSGPSAATGC